MSISVLGVLLVAVVAGSVTLEVESSLEVCAVDVVVVSALVCEIVEIGRLVITLPTGSEKMSETPWQSQTS